MVSGLCRMGRDLRLILATPMGVIRHNPVYGIATLMPHAALEAILCEILPQGWRRH